jgi:hypothetical protein
VDSERTWTVNSGQWTARRDRVPQAINMMVRLVMFSAILSAAAAMAETTAVCPWLATGSAARYLGGDVTGTAHVEGDRLGSCRFVRNTGTPAQTLEVVVSKTDSQPCKEGGTKLPALGNEAVECSRPVAQGLQESVIAGRVRDVYFVITMNGPPGPSPDPHPVSQASELYRPSPLERASEQVVGNLF